MTAIPPQKNSNTWIKNVIKEDEITKYLQQGKDFINDDLIISQLDQAKNPEKSYIHSIIDKALSIERLEPGETAALLNVMDQDLWSEIYEAAGQIKKTVYDNRIVTFAPLYCGNLCVNNCLYCGFRTENTSEKRRLLSIEEIKKEAEALCKIGHKRLILVYGEHPSSDADYMADSIKAIYDTKIPTKKGFAQIRRVNINAAPMSISDLKKLWSVGIGTYQVFQETYHHQTYQKVHPSGIKSHYQWRLYALHRGMDAGIDDLAIGALFGLYDWRFEVMGLLYHAIDMENHFGVGPHTVSFPRLTPAEGAAFSINNQYQVSDKDFKKIVAVLRLSIPYSGMIITARESAEVRRAVIPLGCTQTDASTRIGIGSYSEQYNQQEKERQQFMLGDTRSLDELIREFAENGTITSFCTAGYRCGRTGDKIMGMLKNGHEGKFCKLNAILTFREWLDDFASEETKQAGEQMILKEIEEAKKDPFYTNSKLFSILEQYYGRIKNGERDLFI
ncbi:MAG: [FeFe] hydrogenase H-cluster radical SAM maturase HydG [Spirochaetes bacterium]|nr:[FeFe] hydrogenase H-cluster radical SAM maturase HydG [Spirochaetota bacterium]